MEEKKDGSLIVCDGWCDNIEITEDDGIVIPLKIPKEVKKQIKYVIKSQKRELKRRKIK